MARLISLALADHARIGPSFVIRFSWNSRLENPIERVKGIPAAYLDLLGDLFENWQEEVAILAAADPGRFSAVVTAVLRDRLHAAIGAVLEAAPAVPGDDILAAVGGAVGRWLEQWRRTAPEAGGILSSAQLADARAAARRARADQRSWARRAAFTQEFLAPVPPGDAPG